jgi:hypothetical protein
MNRRTAAIIIGLGGVLGCVDGAGPERVVANEITEEMFQVATRNSAVTRLEREIHRAELLDDLDFFDLDVDLPTGGGECPPGSSLTEAELDVHRSLMVHDLATLQARDFSLSRTLKKIAADANAKGVAGLDDLAVFRELWDTQNPAPGLGLGAHCNDGVLTATGNQLDCPRPEGREALGSSAELTDRMRGYNPIALVNRIDLAHQGWRNCGEYRIIYGKTQVGIDQNYLIFEAVLPNPRPGCQTSCMPVADFWAELSLNPDPADRAARLEEFFYGPTNPASRLEPTLADFAPVVTLDHYDASGPSGAYGGAGSGQIRSNQFLQSSAPGIEPWMLKEFKTVVDCTSTPCVFDVVPIEVKLNPYGELFRGPTASLPGPLGTRALDFQASLPGEVATLAAPALLGFTYEVVVEHDAAQSRALSPLVDHYAGQYAATSSSHPFKVAVQAAVGATGTGLSDKQIVNRAAALSCAGCHQPSEFGLTTADALGPALLPDGSSTTVWPDSAGFVHVHVNLDSTGLAHELSPALNDVFLPARRTNLANLIAKDRCECPPHFSFLEPFVIPLVLRAFEAEVRRFEPDIAPVVKSLGAVVAANRRSPGRRDPDQVGRELTLRDELFSLMVARDAAAFQATSSVDPRAVRPTGLVSAEPLRLPASLMDGSVDLEQARLLLVRQWVTEEPPRRTVDGSFNVH